MTIGKNLGLPPTKRTYNDSPKLPLAKCLTGVEFEAENVKDGTALPDDLASFWNVTGDDSLRNNGMEFVLREPLFGEDLIGTITDFCKHAEARGWDANYRTGLHVHIDARNMEVEELVSEMVYYALFEPLVFRWVGDEREGSIFCMPFYKAEGCLPDIAAAVSGQGDHQKLLFSKVDRYAAFNLNALSKHGTVEWRHMKTTWNVDRVIDWVCICQAFKKYARKRPLKPNELLAEMSKGGPQGLLWDILGDRLATQMWWEGAEQAVWSYGLPIAQDVANYLQPTTAQGGTMWDSIKTSFQPGRNPALDNWAKNKERICKDLEIQVPNVLYNDSLIAGNAAAVKAAKDEIIKLLKETLATSSIQVGA